MFRSKRKIIAAVISALPRRPHTVPTEVTRKGRIARLPFDVRERLHDQIQSE